MFVRWS